VISIDAANAGIDADTAAAVVSSADIGDMAKVLVSYADIASADTASDMAEVGDIAAVQVSGANFAHEQGKPAVRVAAINVAADPVELVVGNGLNFQEAGAGYSVGDQVEVGTAESGWITPAMIEVAAVDEAGGITDVTLVDGGSFVGEDGTGNYKLPEPTSEEGKLVELLMKASASSARESQATKVGSAGKLSIAASATALFALVALVAVKRRAVKAADAQAAADGTDSLTTRGVML
jgi:hypothetical protein